MSASRRSIPPRLVLAGATPTLGAAAAPAQGRLAEVVITATPLQERASSPLETSAQQPDVSAT